MGDRSAFTLGPVLQIASNFNKIVPAQGRTGLLLGAKISDIGLKSVKVWPQWHLVYIESIEDKERTQNSLII